MLTTNARVLIADSEPQVRRNLYRRLLELDIFSDCVADGKAALEALAERPFGVVVLDLELPTVDALQIIAAIEGLPAERRPMILATTAADARPALDSELVQIVLRKPLSIDDVAAMISSCMRVVSEPERPRGPDGEGTATRRPRDPQS